MPRDGGSVGGALRISLHRKNLVARAINILGTMPDVGCLFFAVSDLIESEKKTTMMRKLKFISFWMGSATQQRRTCLGIEYLVKLLEAHVMRILVGPIARFVHEPKDIAIAEFQVQGFAFLFNKMEGVFRRLGRCQPHSENEH